MVTGIWWSAGTAAGQTPGVEVANLGGLETRSAALILSGQEAGDLETSVLAIPIPGADESSGKVRVVLVVDVDGKTIVAESAEDSLVTELYVYAIDGSGGLGGILTQAFRIDLAHHRETLDKTGVKFLGHLDLAPDEYSLRVLVLHRRSGRLRLEIENVDVQPLRDRMLLPPLFPEPAASWVVVRESSGAELPFPWVTGDSTWVPATRPSTAEESDFYIAGRGLTGGLRAHVVDEEQGEVLSELGLGDLRPVAAPPLGLEMFAAEVRTAELTGGRHRLQISSADGTAEASIALRIPVSESELAVRGELEQPPVETAERGARVPVAKGRQLVMLLERARAAYLETLSQLSAGDRSGALTTIIAFERDGIGERLYDKTPEVQQQLKGAQVTVAAQLAGRQVEILLAFIELHEQLYRQYHQHRHLFLAGHTRQVMKGLSDLYLQRTRSPEADRMVASAVASVGGYLHGLGARPAALEVYQQALDYDEDHPTALLAKAMLHEAGGDYEEAEKLLRRLVSKDPGNRRGRLHLAVNSRRLGETRRALKLLEECVAEEPANWITALAYQELAALQAAEKKPRQAIATLERALERLPDQQALYLLLAAQLDRNGQHSRATTVLQRLDARGPRASASPRLVYGQPPSSDILHSRQTLADSVRKLLPTLSETVNRFAAVDEGGQAPPDPGTP